MRTTDDSGFEYSDLTSSVIGCAIEVHRILGPGLLESAYEQCLAHELHLSKVPFVTQVALPLRYKGVNIAGGFRVDFIVKKQLIIELKTVEYFSPVHEAQILTYMRLAHAPIGLLINFHSRTLKNGIRRYRL